MAGEWRERTLGELTDNFDGIRVPVKEADRRVGPYPYYGASGIVDHVDEFLFDGEYLLVAEDGENLRTRNTPVAFMARGKFWVNNHAHIVRGNGDADTRFLMYALAASDISGYLTGSTMPKLTQGNMNRIPLLAPPLPEQRAIAHILGTLDDKIELNRKQNETLEAMARALFKAWFVDFEPVRAKMEGRWQRGQSLPGLPAHLYDLFPDRLVDSELGEIPEAWMVKPLQKLLAESKERVDVGSLTSENYISTENMLANRGGITTASSLPSEKTVPAFKKNDVLISNIRPYFKKIWVASCNGGHSPDVLCFRAANNNIQKYLHQLISQDTFFDFMMQTSKGAKMPRGDKSAIMKWNVVFPDMKLASHFSEMLEPFYGQIQAQTQANSNLAQLRDTLLPTLVSGELRVNDVGAQHAVPLQNGERE